MTVETFHPFEIVVGQGLRSSTSKELMVNAGRVYNFYNPSNYRNVKINRQGKELQELPIPMDVYSGEELNYDEFSIKIEDTYKRITVYLIVSFLPPEKWVPCRYFIPKIDEAWLLFRVYSQDNDQSFYSLIGETKNFKEDHIKYENFIINSFTCPDETFFEKYPHFQGNAFNVGIIGCAEKDGAGTWKINQFIKNNFPIGMFLDTKIYETCNTDRYNVGSKEELSEDELLKLEEKSLSILKYLDIKDPETEHYRGYIQYTQNTLSQSVEQLIFPTTESSSKEFILNNNPLFDVS